ncbi:MAG: homocysteine S-methyltransferase family protein [Planctomycetota bacterium]|nr:homocysteine S-methyltransferase family protein [Planctomycetota bacterium]
MPLDLKKFAGRLRVTDGAWGTQLQRMGLPAGSPPELWNVENASAVEEVARGYVEAGSDVIITNTFGANRFVLQKHGAGERVGELAEAGAAISRRAAGTQAKVFGSVGPTGRIVMMQEVPAKELSAAYAEAAGALAGGGADAIVLETFNELADAEIALKAVRSACDLPVVVSMTFASGPDKTATMMGDSPADLVQMAKANAADAVGANCGTGPDKYVTIAEMLRQATTQDLPIWIKANAGLPQIVDGETVFPMAPAEFASYVPKLITAGANFIGGCCGTTPEHIRAIRAAVDNR